ncbi:MULTISPECIES: hypothetical protein [unclassified Saccharopolyspora]|uniref:hypothetical protein n=1 Tax=unclassified Saccharopolyspora TaxID=2646250 RepID=UPI001CD69A19|nr:MULTISPECIES: hypothetical protein [unclassified Saccharopolyspora]MCA1190162.1 hypothetical protein [Saccharopolyspora sp. 6T]MCA1194556.1 hypothetical protein [Saccharopolyspora sp. 6V]MCA1226741.1 hypothetical protein [Saccharopolyspora sp. 6M]MCA1281628.1 hypothetical protein [Saccharopolyspora sp. 7B]
MTPSAVSRSALATTEPRDDDLLAPRWPGGDPVSTPPGGTDARPDRLGHPTGTGVSWGGLIEQPAPGAGPHRIRAISACAADAGAHDPFADTGPLPAVAPTTGAAIGAAPAEPGTDPLSDTVPVGGLHKFDLGMVPASVTPPRSSRRAAWFAVASAGAAFGGLLLVATALVTPTTSIEGLRPPNMPRATHFPSPAPEPHADGPDLLADRAPTSGLVPPPPGPPRQQAPGAVDHPPGRAPADGPPDSAPGASEPGGEVSTEPAAAPPAPPRQSAPVTYRDELLTFTDPRLVAARSEHYFDAVRAHDLAGAYAGTTGRLRAAGFAAFAERYRDAAAVEVLSVSATSSSTVTTLRITRTDGSVAEQQRRLRFTSGSDPRVYADDVAW